MNRVTKSAFDRIKSAASSYQEEVTHALTEYKNAEKRARADSEQYKDAESKYNALQGVAAQTAKNVISTAEAAFTGNVSAELKVLHEALSEHLTARPSPAFLDALRVYKDFDIVPSKTELSALLEQAHGNPLALKAIGATLDSVKSPYRIEYTTTADFEKDLAALETLTRPGNLWSPIEMHSEATRLFSGQAVNYYRPDGSSYQTGQRVDGTHMMLRRSAFEQTVKGLDDMAERWANDVVPSVKQAKDYKPKTNEHGEEITAAEQYIKDRESTGSGVQISDDSAMRRAVEIASERTADNAVYSAVMERYGR